MYAFSESLRFRLFASRPLHATSFRNEQNFTLAQDESQYLLPPVCKLACRH